MSQQQRKSNGADRSQKETETSTTAGDKAKKPVEAKDKTVAEVDKEKDKTALDKIVDELDDLLEENAEEFVKGYKQQGGE
jgi:ubiquitin-like protein Pup